MIPSYTADLSVFDSEPLQSQVVKVTFPAATAGTHNAVTIAQQRCRLRRRMWR